MKTFFGSYFWPQEAAAWLLRLLLHIQKSPDSVELPWKSLKPLLNRLVTFSTVQRNKSCMHDSWNTSRFLLGIPRQNFTTNRVKTYLSAVEMRQLTTWLQDRLDRSVLTQLSRCSQQRMRQRRSLLPRRNYCNQPPSATRQPRPHWQRRQSSPIDSYLEEIIIINSLSSKCGNLWQVLPFAPTLAKKG